MFETLFNPEGQVAAYSLIGSDQSGFGHVEVRQPMAGTWTAVIFTVNNPALYQGAVQFNYETQRFNTAGSAYPASRTLAPGQSADFRVRTAPGAAGDESYRLHLGTGSSTDGSIPVVVRSLVPLGYHGGTFSGELTGGGSTGNAGQSFTYQFRLPYGRPSLNVALQLADPGYNLNGFLVDPNGQPVDVQSTGQFDAQGNVGFGPTMQFFRGHPQSGLWTVTLNVSGPVPGTHLSEPFRGNVTFAPVPVSASGVPSSHHARLKSGRPVTATIRVTNTGNIPKDFLVDPRLNRRVPQVLLGSDINNVGLPLSLTAQPNWLVPPGTNALATFAQGSIPITTETSFALATPTSAVCQSATPRSANCSHRSWLQGSSSLYRSRRVPAMPLGRPGDGSSANLAAVANTYEFDSDVTSTTGDGWKQSVDPNAIYTPLTLAPGASGTITVTFTPSGHHGAALVRGFLGLDTLNLFTASGDEIAQIPYEYRIR